MGIEEQNKAMEEAKTYVIAGLSLRRPVNLEDIKWAVERGFSSGMNYALIGDSE